MEHTLLRMGYTHPMDDGQQRTFKVKFEGEGVDDYGGPYREVFAQVSEELQAMVTVPGGDSPQCLLPIMRPTPDASADNVKAVKGCKLTLQPSRLRHVDMEMYNFLGQLIGIALRSRIFVRVNFPSIIWKALVGEPVLESDLVGYDSGVAAFIKKVRQLLKAKTRLHVMGEYYGPLGHLCTGNGGELSCMRCCNP